jgi:hypothetical protein
MSSSKAIAIPKRKGKQIAGSESSAPSTPSYSTPSYNSNSNRYSFGSPSYGSTPSTSPESMKRRESLMSAAFSAQEHTVINVGEEECPRLITCVKASQGFDWNQGMSFRPLSCLLSSHRLPTLGSQDGGGTRLHVEQVLTYNQKSFFLHTQTTTSTTSSADRIPSRTLWSRMRRLRLCFRNKPRDMAVGVHHLGCVWDASACLG